MTSTVVLSCFLGVLLGKTALRPGPVGGSRRLNGRKQAEQLERDTHSDINQMPLDRVRWSTVRSILRRHDELLTHGRVVTTRVLHALYRIAERKRGESGIERETYNGSLAITDLRTPS